MQPVQPRRSHRRRHRVDPQAKSPQRKESFRRRRLVPSAFAGVLALILCPAPPSLPALDWPNFRGPDHNGVSRETGWFKEWPRQGPRQAWRAKVGTGFACFAVANGRAYTTGNQNNTDTLFCFDAATGKELWTHSYPCPLDPHYYDGGTSATPTVDGQVVYQLSRRGHLLALDAATGQVHWSMNVAEQTGAKVPEWGFASSPLVWRELLILNVGSAGTAVDKRTGRIVWTSGKGAAGYATAVPRLVDERAEMVLLAQEQLVGLDPATGRERWSYPWKTRYKVNATDPVILRDKLFIATGYNRGGAVLDLSGAAPRIVWEGKQMRNHFNACVLVDGFLYGFDGDVGDRGLLKCLDFQTGTVLWAHEGLGTGALTAADGKLIILSERGELLVAEASPKGFHALARAQILGGKCWTAPVLANGRVYCRNSRGDVACVIAGEHE